jgi:uncharacterized protein YodC (DUF2158 family)
MNPHAFNIGDTVYLKSGSPALMINSFERIGMRRIYNCVWFDNNCMKYDGSFSEETLTKTKF